MFATMTASVTRVGLVQRRSQGDSARNLASAIDGIAEAAAKGCQVVGLQELFLSDYFCQSEDPAIFDLAEPIPGPTSAALAEAAAKHRVVVVGSLFEKRAEGVFHNSAPVFGADGTLLGVYRTSRTTRCTTRSSTSRRATTASSATRRRPATSPR